MRQKKIIKSWDDRQVGIDVQTVQHVIHLKGTEIFMLEKYSEKCESVKFYQKFCADQYERSVNVLNHKQFQLIEQQQHYENQLIEQNRFYENLCSEKINEKVQIIDTIQNEKQVLELQILELQDKIKELSNPKFNVTEDKPR